MPAVEDSILLTIKQMLGGLDPTYDSEFDLDIITHINASLATLTQVGVGPKEGFEITDDTATWHDYIGDDKRLNFIKRYIYADVKYSFDPPRTSFAFDAIEKQKEELLWRINIQVDPGDNNNG
jgi:hypothetical protein